NTAILQRHILIHELAHFCGATQGPRAIPDKAYLDEKAKWKKLNAEQRLHTADSYAFVALELQIGTVDATREVHSDDQHIPIYPIAGNGAVGYGFDVWIVIPKAPNEKFDYPAGAMF